MPSVLAGSPDRFVEYLLDAARADAAREPVVDERLHRGDLGMALLVAADQVTNIFAVIGVTDLGLDPFVLLLGYGDRLACGHFGLSDISYH